MTPVPPHPRHHGADPDESRQREASRRKSLNRVLFISDLPCRSSARQQLSEACGRPVVPVQRPASQLLANPQLARGYAVAVLHQVGFDRTSRVLHELLRSGVTTVLVPRYQDATQVVGDSRPKVVGYAPLAVPSLGPPPG